MTKTRALFLNFACWSAVLALPVCGVAYAAIVSRVYTEAARGGLSGFWCGNTVTDPLVLILSVGTPAAVVSVAALGALRLRQFVNTGSLITAAVLTAGCTGALMEYGARFFRAALPGHHLSNLVWWMWPIGDWISI
jgi:hypothetical protein